MARRFNSTLNVHVHFHLLALDGVDESHRENAPLAFVPAPTPTPEQLQRLLERTAKRIRALVAQQPRAPEPAEVQEPLLRVFGAEPGAPAEPKLVAPLPSRHAPRSWGRSLARSGPWRRRLHVRRDRSVAWHRLPAKPSQSSFSRKGEAMDLLGFLILLVVAFVAGACGELIAGGKVPGGWLGSIVAGLIGAWLGGALIHFGPILGGIQIIPAIIGAALFVFVLRLLTRGVRRTV